MTLSQLTAFATSDEQHVRQVALTRAGAKQLVAEIEALRGAEPAQFEIDTRNRPIDAHFQLRRLKRMRAEDAAAEARL